MTNPWPLLLQDPRCHVPGQPLHPDDAERTTLVAERAQVLGTKDTPMRRWIYAAGTPRGNEATYLERYRQHNAKVRAYFAERNDFLVLDLERGQGWPELCAFLNLPSPTPPSHTSTVPKQRKRQPPEIPDGGKLRPVGADLGGDVRAATEPIVGWPAGRRPASSATAAFLEAGPLSSTSNGGLQRPPVASSPPSALCKYALGRFRGGGRPVASSRDVLLATHTTSAPRPPCADRWLAARLGRSPQPVLDHPPSSRLHAPASNRQVGWFI